MDKQEAQGWIMLAGGAVVIVALSGGLNKVLSALGLGNTADEAETAKRLSDAAEAASLSSSPWSPTFFAKAPIGALVLTQSGAEALALQIYNSVGMVYDEPEQALNAFKQLKTQSQLSYLSYIFGDVYGYDLYTWLEYHFDTAAQKYVLVRIGDYVMSLPKYNV